jgi:hypothetical protein
MGGRYFVEPGVESDQFRWYLSNVRLAHEKLPAKEKHEP